MNEEHRTDDQNIESAALASITIIERILFSRIIKRNIRSKTSKFYTLLPRYGVAGATCVVTGNLWLLPLIVFLVVAVILHASPKPNDPAQLVSHVSFALSLGCCAIGIARVARGAVLGSRFRASKWSDS